MDDRALAAVAREFACGDQGRDRGRGDRFAPFVDDEAAVGVSVEGEAEVGALFADALLEIHEVRRVQGVGLVVGEGAVQLEVHGDEGQGQTLEDRGNGVAAHAVARVDHDLQGADGGQVDEGAKVRRVILQRVGPGDRSRVRRGFGGARVRPAFRQLADLRQARVLADGGGARAAQLDAVVLGRVVRGREHGAGEVQRARGVVQLVRGAQADLGDVHAECRCAAREGAGEAGRGGAHVVADDDRLGAGHPREGRPEELGQRLVPLVRDHPAYVVRLHDL